LSKEFLTSEEEKKYVISLLNTMNYGSPDDFKADKKVP